ncbi:2-dehydro-3-deoxygluconokinase [Kroppenstedtia sanguinis]|uniref:sugar kinase n=1 Tax=Kroppenstedtia sanguinis TaxID=1380684 RepID=UPI003D19D7B0
MPVRSVLAFGEVMMRLEVPAYATLEQSRTLHYLFSGSGVNVLSGLSKYGYSTRLISKLPANRLGDAALAHLRMLGLSTSSILRGGEYMGMYFLESGFGVRSSKVTYTNRKESAFCQSQLEEYEMDVLLADANWIHFCGISLAVTPNVREIVVALAVEAKKRGLTVSFDCNFRPKLWGSYAEAKPWYEKMLSLADICMISEQDAIHILNWETKETDREKQMQDFLPKISETFNLPVVAGTIREVVSDGHFLKGFVLMNGEMACSKPYRFPVLDRIGAGDAFAGGVIHGVLENLSSQETVNFAVAASVYAHTTYGDSPIAGLKEIQEWMESSFREIER